MAKQPTNIVASIKARLTNIARAKGMPFDLLLIQFVLERILYRLSISDHRHQFILKGGMLLITWIPDDARVTRDLDFLAHGEASEEFIREVFAELFSMDVDDGLEFAIGQMRISSIREEMEYGGYRLKTVALLDRTRIPVTVDIGYGDAVMPAANDIEYPVLLDMAPPKIRSYPPETVIAEKFQALVALGMANSRMKDYYDLWMLGAAVDLDMEKVAAAIAATFNRRKTKIPHATPVGLTVEFGNDETKLRQWRLYLESLGVAPVELTEVVSQIASYLMPVAELAAKGVGRNAES